MEPAAISSPFCAATSFAQEDAKPEEPLKHSERFLAEARARNRLYFEQVKNLAAYFQGRYYYTQRQ